MNLNALCFYLSLWATGVFGSLAAGPFQSMYLWYGYRMEILAFHGESNPEGIANGCKGTVADGSCYFDEFLRHIKIGKQKWTGTSGVGSELHPDVFETAQKLRKDVSGYNNAVDPKKLFPNAGLRDAPSWGEIFGPVADRIQKCRQKVGDEVLKLELNQARQALFMVHDTRVADQAKALREELNQELAKKQLPWEVETKTFQLQNGGSYETIDTRATLVRHINEPQVVLDLVKNYASDFNTMTQSNRNHRTAIQECQKLIGKLLSSC